MRCYRDMAEVRDVSTQDMGLSWRHGRIVAVASLGQVSGTLLSTVVGVAIPMIQLTTNHSLTPLMQGLMGAASLIGIMVGAFVFGPLEDRYGYKFFYRFCPALVLVAALLGYLIKDEWWFMLMLFVMGCGIGGEYSLDSAYISELMPVKWKQFMTGVAKAASAIGNISAGLCWWLLVEWDTAAKWNCLLLLSGGLALLTLVCRIHAFESPAWLVSHGRDAQAQALVKRLFGPNVFYAPPKSATEIKGKEKLGVKQVIFTGVPWACESFAVYGFAVFLPVLVMALGLEHGSGSGFASIVGSVRTTTYINLFVLVGFVIGLLLIRRWSHVRMQWVGFVLSAAGLGLMLVTYRMPGMAWACIVGFMAFEMFLNAGPHLITFVLPTEVYPPSDRATGSGVAAAMGKVGSVTGVFVIPMLLRGSGVGMVLGVSIGVLLLGALVTVLLRKEA